MNEKGNLFVALVALVAGIISPPLWKIVVKEGQPWPSMIFKDPSSSSSEKESRQLSEKTSSSGIDGGSGGVSHYSCSSVELANYLHTAPVRGMHVVCLDATTNRMTMYKGSSSSPINPVLEETVEGRHRTWADLKPLLVSKLGLQAMHALKQPWATFSPTGERLLAEDSPGDASTEQMFALGMFLVIEGGQWVWPGVEKGFIRHIQLDAERNATLKTLSLNPLVLSVDGFLTDEECDWIKMTAEPDMAQSWVSLMDHDKGRPDTDFRTSETKFLTTPTPEINAIDQKTASLVRVPQNHQEPPQVLRYKLNAKYDQHNDYFDPKFYQNDAGTLQMIENGRKNRMATVLWYLSDVEAGGETVFPRMDNAAPVPNDKACQHGLRVKPEKGKVIIFYSLKPDGSMDPLSVHGACPVLGGVKWAANKWVWNAPR
jgi:prolyl 4-hydroxylase